MSVHPGDRVEINQISKFGTIVSAWVTVMTVFHGLGPDGSDAFSYARHQEEGITELSYAVEPDIIQRKVPT